MRTQSLLIVVTMGLWMGCSGKPHGGGSSGDSSSSTGSMGGAAGAGAMGGAGGESSIGGAGGESSIGGAGGAGATGGMGGIGGTGGAGATGGMGGTGGMPPAPTPILQLGGSHVCMVLPDERVKCWGGNTHAELGLEDIAHRGDNPGEMGDNLPAVSIGTGKTVQALAANEVANAVLLNNGHLKAWGHGSSYSYGDSLTRGDSPGDMGDNLPEIDLGAGKMVRAIFAGTYHTCAILTDGGIKCWGNNNFGKLGQGTNVTAIGDNAGELGDNLPAIDLGTNESIVAFTAGYNHSCVVFADSTMKCWGGNSLGELGLGDTMTRGDGPNEMGSNLATVNLGTGKSAVAIAAGYNHTCAILNDKSVKCWGYNAAGQLGLGDTNHRGDQPNEMGDNLPAVDLGAGKVAIALSAGQLHTCALLEGGTMKCWGSNAYGNLGLEDNQNRGDGPNEMGDNLPEINLGTKAVVTKMSSTLDFTCALLQGNALKCWGRNDYGNLGLGDRQNRGDNPGEMGDNLPFVTP